MSELNASILPKQNNTAGSAPLPEQLEVGEIALNTADGKIFTKHTDGTIKEISGAGGVEEAPNDGLPYVRQNEAWAIASSGGGSGGDLPLGAAPGNLLIWAGSAWAQKPVSGVLAGQSGAKSIIQLDFEGTDVPVLNSTGMTTAFPDSDAKFGTGAAKFVRASQDFLSIPYPDFIGNNGLQTSVWTLEVWVKTADNDYSGTIARRLVAPVTLTNNDNGFQVTREPNGGDQFTPHVDNAKGAYMLNPAGTKDAYIVSTRTVVTDDDQWHHLVFSHEGDGLYSCFWDGLLTERNQLANPVSFSDLGGLLIGKRQDDNAGGFFEGSVDNFSLSNIAKYEGFNSFPLPAIPSAAVGYEGGVLEDLSNVDGSVAPTDGQTLVYDASEEKWVPGANGAVMSVNGESGDVSLGIQDMDDVLTPFADGDFLSWDDATQQFTPTQVAPGGVTSVNDQTGDVSLGVSDLDDTLITNPATGNVLTWGVTAPAVLGQTLLLDFETDPALDTSIDARNLTAQPGYAQSGTTYKFGSYSLFAEDGLITGLAVDNSDGGMDIGDEDFTVDAWLRIVDPSVSSGNAVILGKRGSGGYTDRNSYTFGWSATSRALLVTIGSGGGGTNYEATWEPTAGTWHHLAFTRESGTLRLFADGALLSTNNAPETFYSNSGVSAYVGAYNEVIENGLGDYYLDEVSVIVGQAVYTASFTPPTTPYSALGSVTEYGWVNGPAAASQIAWTVDAVGTSAYTFSGPGLVGAENNPTLYVVRGQKYSITNLMGAHPLQIQSTSGLGGAAYSDGIEGNPVENGRLEWEVRLDAPDTLYYQCTSHANMAGTIVVVGGGGSGDVESVNGQTGVVSLGVQDMNDFALGSASDFTWVLTDPEDQQSGMQPSQGYLTDTGTVTVHPTSQEGDVKADLVAWGNSLTYPTTITFVFDGVERTATVTAFYDQSNDTGDYRPRISFGTDGDPFSGEQFIGQTLTIKEFNLSQGPTVPLASGDVLRWDDTVQKFRPQQLPASSGGKDRIQDMDDFGYSPVVETGQDGRYIFRTAYDQDMCGSGAAQANTYFQLALVDADGADHTTELSNLGGGDRIWVQFPGQSIEGITLQNITDQPEAGACRVYFQPLPTGTATLPDASEVRVWFTEPASLGDPLPLANGDILQWDDTAQEFRPVQLSAGGGSGAVDSVNGQTGVVSLGIQDMNDYSPIVSAYGELAFDSKITQDGLNDQVLAGEQWTGTANANGTWLYLPDTATARLLVGGVEVTLTTDTGLSTTVTIDSNSSSATDVHPIKFEAPGEPTLNQIASSPIGTSLTIVSPVLPGVSNTPLAEGEILRWSVADQAFRPFPSSELDTDTNRIQDMQDFGLNSSDPNAYLVGSKIPNDDLSNGLDGNWAAAVNSSTNNLWIYLPKVADLEQLTPGVEFTLTLSSGDTFTGTCDSNETSASATHALRWSSPPAEITAIYNAPDGTLLTINSSVLTGNSAPVPLLDGDLLQWNNADQKFKPIEFDRIVGGTFGSGV